MLADVFESTSGDDHSEALFSDSGVTRWARLAVLFAQYLERWADLKAQRIALPFPATAEALATLAAFQRLNKNVFLVDAHTPLSKLKALGQQLNLDAVIDAADFRKAYGLKAETTEASSTAAVTILTSGTSGRPKASQYSWSKLARPVRLSDQPQRWFMAYQPHLYAGLQVVLQAMLNRGTLVVPATGARPLDVVRLMAQSATGYVSATPSYWRRLLLLVPPTELGRVRLKQITLGGEVVDQVILDQLMTTFPTVRIAHIYATTEVGRCFSVTDGQAGFPLAYLDRRSPDGVELRIGDGQLFVRSENAMTGYDSSSEALPARLSPDGWFATGDLVQVDGDRVHFVGRKSDMINVGGNKVHPVEVEKIVRELRTVAEVRVYAQPSSIAGQLVACDVVAAGDADPESVRQQVLEHCGQRLTRYQCPRIVRVVEQLDLNRAGKMKRSSGPSG